MALDVFGVDFDNKNPLYEACNKDEITTEITEVLNVVEHNQSDDSIETSIID